MRSHSARLLSLPVFLRVLLFGLLAIGLSQVSRAATVTFDATTPAANRLIDVGSATYEGYDVVVSGITMTINGTHAFASLTVQNGATVTHAPGLVGGMNLTISGSVTVNSGCAINLTGAGYGGAQGPGAGANGFSVGSIFGNGGSYGGRGGIGANNALSASAYGSITQPTDLGSGGGNGQSGTVIGGAGGGAVKLSAGALNLLGTGSITANGVYPGEYAGGGGGGSVWISVQTLSGQGTVSAVGGSSPYGEGGSGAGGRIALYYADKSSFSGSVSATSNSGRSGGAGTIYSQQNGQASGSLIIDNGSLSGQATPIPNGMTLANLTIQNRAVVTPAGGILPDGGTLILTVQNSFTLANYGRLTTQGYGYGAAQGPGAGATGFTANNTRGSGGSYGGRGGYGYNGVAPANAYGSILQPTDLGSGGGNGQTGATAGGSGGGAIRLTVNGTLNIGQYCSIDASGTDGGNTAGGGSGGSVWITAQALTGQGTVSAIGGVGDQSAGGGGGGRIALYYADKSGFSGSITATGNASSYNSGNTYGGAGTIYFQQTGQALGDLLVDNGGLVGETTPLIGIDTINTLTVKGRGNVTPPGDSFPAGSTLTLTTLGDLTVAADGRISAQGYGYPSSQAPAGSNGAGSNGVAPDQSSLRGGGGGYGGKGGLGYGSVPGGGVYGSATQPTDLGSGGGSGYLGSSPGGAGGGAIRLIINGTLHLNGAIDANGNDGGNRAGGGSGGSVWITALGIDGAGSLLSNGGIGNDYGGGGGGGRVALYYNNNTNFSGSLQAIGGSSNNQYGANGVVNSYAFSSAYTLSNLTVTPGAVAGGQTATGIITLSGPAPTGGVSVALASGNPANASVPVSVTIPEGQTTATFPITPISQNQTYTVTITASLGGIVKSGAFAVNPWLGSLALTPASVAGGQTVNATLTLNLPAPSGGLVVALAASDPALTFPNGATLTFAAGTTTQKFTLRAGSVTAAKSATLTATYLAEMLAASVYLNPAGVQVQSVAVTPGSVVGGNVATGVVTLNGPAPTGGSLVALTSSDAATATLSASILVPAGQTSAAFTIKTMPVATMKSLLISATLGLTQITTLTVRQSGIGALTILPASIIAGNTSIGIVTLDAAATAPITVTISSNQSAAVPVASLIIPVGQTTGNFHDFHHRRIRPRDRPDYGAGQWNRQIAESRALSRRDETRHFHAIGNGQSGTMRESRAVHYVRFAPGRRLRAENLHDHAELRRLVCDYRTAHPEI